jgi:uncharacterized membrane protein
MRAWEMYRKNAISFVVAELLTLVITGIIALVGIVILFGSVGISNLMNLSNPELMITKIVSILSLLFELTIASIFFIIAGIVWAFLQTGIYGMAAESLRGPTKVKTMFEVAKKNGFKGIVSSVILSVISFVLFMILIIGLNIAMPIIGGIIGMILFFFVSITFSIVLPGIVTDDLSSINAIKESFKTTKKNYLDTLGLLLLYSAISLVVLIPFIGIIIYFFVISPMMKISLIFFYKRKKL